MAESVEAVAEEPIDRSAASKIASEFKRRATKLAAIGAAALSLIVLLIGFAIAAFYYADSLTSSQIDVIEHKLAMLVSEQSELSAQLAPSLLSLIRNINAFDQTFEAHALNPVKGEDFDYKRDVGKYNYISNLRVTSFGSTEALKGTIAKIVKNNVLHDTIVIKMNVPLVGISSGDYTDQRAVEVLNKGYVPKYFWSFKVKDASKINEIIDKSGMDKLFNIFDIEERILQRKANEVKIEELRVRKITFQDDNISGAHLSSLQYDKQLNLNRFGPLVLVSILVAILSSFYKYNIKMAAYYLARYDALTLQPSQKSLGFVRLSVALTPTIDFSKVNEGSLVGSLLGKVKPGA